MRSVTVIDLRLCDRKKSLGARRFGLYWIRFTFAANSRSGSSSAVVVSNCYQLAWILAVSRVASEVCDSRSWLKFKREHSPLFLLPSWRWRSPPSKWFGYPLTTKLMRAKLVLTWQTITRGSCVRKAWKPSSSRPISIFLNLEASLHSLLSFAWTLTRPTN